jgi:hypothetical protein
MAKLHFMFSISCCGNTLFNDTHNHIIRRAFRYMQKTTRVCIRSHTTLQPFTFVMLMFSSFQSVFVNWYAALIIKSSSCCKPAKRLDKKIPIILIHVIIRQSLVKRQLISKQLERTRFLSLAWFLSEFFLRLCIWHWQCIKWWYFRGKSFEQFALFSKKHFWF